MIPLIIIPGVNSGAYLFEAARSALGEARDVVVLDPPGVGERRLPLPFTVHAYARQVCDIIEQKSWKRVDVLGHSMGGFVAQEVARILPRVVRRLVLVSTSCGQPYSAEDMLHLARVSGRSFWQTMQLVERDPETGMALFFGERFVSEQGPAYRAFLQERQRHLPGKAVSLAHLTAGGAFSSAGWVHKLRQPALVIHGTADNMVTLASGKALAARLANSRLIELYGIGHFPMLEHGRFYDYVAQFLDGAVVGDDVEHDAPSLWQRLKDWLGRDG